MKSPIVVALCALVITSSFALNGCSSIEPRPVRTGPAQAAPEPPPWNSLELWMMDTEIVSIDPLERRHAAAARSAITASNALARAS